MKKRLFIILLGLAYTTVLYSYQAIAKSTNLDISSYTTSFINSINDASPIYIQSDAVKINRFSHIIFTGNVNIKQGNNRLTANEVHLTRRFAQNNIPICTIVAIGNVKYDSNEVKLFGSKAQLNCNTKNANFYKGSYQISSIKGRGVADNIIQSGNNTHTILKKGSFTTCPIGNNSWNIIGSKIVLDRKRQVLKIWNSRFKVGKLPIFYVPYLQIPFGDKLHYNFFMPDTKYSVNNGLEITVPYYLNLTHNYSIIITPQYMGKRGTKLKTDLHYKIAPGNGLIEFSWLPKSHIYREKYKLDKNNRWDLHWIHDGTIHHLWNINVDYSNMSKSGYSKTLNIAPGSSLESYVNQKLRLSYSSKNWSSSISYKQFQPSKLQHNNYRAAPQLNLTYYGNDISLLKFKMFGQVTNFTNLNDKYPKTIRLHIEPTVNLPLSNNWGALNTETKLMLTHFQQKHTDYYNSEVTDTEHRLKESVNRILPQFKTDGKIILERCINNRSNHTQTLEARLQYLYIPYRDQRNIGIYDSAILQTDYFSLFRDRLYSGFDRISQANQLTGSITSRIYDDQYTERFNVSLGQSYSLLSHKTSDIKNIKVNNSNISTVWAGTSHWRINNRWVIHNNLQYSSIFRNMMLVNSMIEYNKNKNRAVQLSCSYTKPHYINHLINNTQYSYYYQDVSQIGVVSSLPILNNWSLISKHYYSNKINKLTNQLIHLEYKTCCWTIDLGYEHNITNWRNITDSYLYDNKISFGIKLHGLNDNYNSETSRITNSSMCFTN